MRTTHGIPRAVARIASLALVALACAAGCREQTPPPVAPRQAASLPGEGGADFLISALDEVEGIAAYTGHFGPPGRAILPGKRALIAATAADSTYIYGEVTPEGYGAVVTERHTYPKGILLITVRKSYGTPPSHIVTQTKRYISFADLAADSAQQSTVTELYGLSADTLVTHVTRNGILETYTFRLPVVTRVVNPQDGSVRVTTRSGAAGAVRSEVRDGTGALIQLRLTSGAPDGSLNVYTEFPDGSWRNIRTVGEADGTVLRETTSGS